MHGALEGLCLFTVFVTEAHQVDLRFLGFFSYFSSVSNGMKMPEMPVPRESVKVHVLSQCVDQIS